MNIIIMAIFLLSKYSNLCILQVILVFEVIYEVDYLHKKSLFFMFICI